MWKGYLPEWIPFYGGKYFTFFEPVFNIADMAISTGVGMLIVFNKRAFPNQKTVTKTDISSEALHNN
jgi:signal peptidase II